MNRGILFWRGSRCRWRGSVLGLAPRLEERADRRLLGMRHVAAGCVDTLFAITGKSGGKKGLGCVTDQISNSGCRPFVVAGPPGDPCPRAESGPEAAQAVLSITPPHHISANSNWGNGSWWVFDSGTDSETGTLLPILAPPFVTFLQDLYVYVLRSGVSQVAIVGSEKTIQTTSYFVSSPLVHGSVCLFGYFPQSGYLTSPPPPFFIPAESGRRAGR